MKNKDRNNNQGIFYAVIGIATLVVTIIGATFAFFSASTGSAPGAVNTSAATVGLEFTPDASGIKGSLIPIDETLPRFAEVVGIPADANARDCQDDNGNNICSVYQFTILNPSTTAFQRIFVTLTPTVNEFTNLHYAVFKGSDSDIKGTQAKYDVDGTAVTTVSDANANIIGADGDLVISDTAFGANSTTAITLTPLEQVLSPSGSVTYTIVLWIHEISNDANPAHGGDQTAVDSIITDSQTNETRGRQFAATINVTTAGGTGGVTGVLNTNSGGQGNS